MNLFSFSRLFAKLGQRRCGAEGETRSAPSRAPPVPGAARRPDPAVQHAGGRRDQPERRLRGRLRPASRDGPDQQPVSGRSQHHRLGARRRGLHQRRTDLDAVHVNGSNWAERFRRWSSTRRRSTPASAMERIPTRLSPAPASPSTGTETSTSSATSTTPPPRPWPSSAGDLASGTHRRRRQRRHRLRQFTFTVRLQASRPSPNPPSATRSSTSGTARTRPTTPPSPSTPTCPPPLTGGPSFTDPTTGATQTDTMAVLINPTTGAVVATGTSDAVPKGIYVGWNINFTEPERKQPGHGQPHHDRRLGRRRRPTSPRTSMRTPPSSTRRLWTTGIGSAPQHPVHAGIADCGHEHHRLFDHPHHPDRRAAVRHDHHQCHRRHRQPSPTRWCF